MDEAVDENVDLDEDVEQDVDDGQGPPTRLKHAL